MKADARFRMTKAHGAETLKIAIAEKKIDPLMIPISEKIAGTKHYFTTSTCSGRITLMDLEENEGKREGAFYRKWHRVVKFHEVWKAIEEYDGKRNLWLKQDALVFVIGTDTFAHARHLFTIFQTNGLKRFGIHHFEDGKVMVEVFGTQAMSVPIVQNGKLMVDTKYVQTLVKIANRKWKQNHQKLQQLNRALAKELE